MSEVKSGSLNCSFCGHEVELHNGKLKHVCRCRNDPIKTGDEIVYDTSCCHCRCITPTTRPVKFKITDKVILTQSGISFVGKQFPVQVPILRALPKEINEQCPCGGGHYLYELAIDSMPKCWGCCLELPEKEEDCSGYMGMSCGKNSHIGLLVKCKNRKENQACAFCIGCLLESEEENGVNCGVFVTKHYTKGHDITVMLERVDQPTFLEIPEIPDDVVKMVGRVSDEARRFRSLMNNLDYGLRLLKV